MLLLHQANSILADDYYSRYDENSGAQDDTSAGLLFSSTGLDTRYIFNSLYQVGFSQCSIYNRLVIYYDVQLTQFLFFYILMNHMLAVIYNHQYI